MRLTFLLLLFALAVVRPALLPLPVRAATSSGCSVYIDAFAKDLQTNTAMVDDLARPSDPSPDHVAQSAARYNRDVGYAKLCPSFKKAFADALLTTWKAWLEHATSHTNPVDTAALASQKLDQCTLTYSGTDDGATCATWEKQVAKWQDEWRN